MARNSTPRGHQKLQEKLLHQIGRGAALCREIEQSLARHPSPEPVTLIKLFQVIILKLSLQANPAPDQLKVVNALMKPVLEWARLEEQRKVRKFAERKYDEQAASERAAREKGASDASGENALSPETLEKIERELKLF